MATDANDVGSILQLDPHVQVGTLEDFPTVRYVYRRNDSWRAWASHIGVASGTKAFVAAHATSINGARRVIVVEAERRFIAELDIIIWTIAPETLFDRAKVVQKSTFRTSMSAWYPLDISSQQRGGLKLYCSAVAGEGANFALRFELLGRMGRIDVNHLADGRFQGIVRDQPEWRNWLSDKPVADQSP